MQAVKPRLGGYGLLPSRRIQDILSINEGRDKSRLDLCRASLVFIGAQTYKQRYDLRKISFNQRRLAAQGGAFEVIPPPWSKAHKPDTRLSAGVLPGGHFQFKAESDT